MEGRSRRMKAAESDYHNPVAAGTVWSDKAAILSSLPYKDGNCGISSFMIAISAA